MTDRKGDDNPIGFVVAGFPYRILQMSSLCTRWQAVVNNRCTSLHIRSVSARILMDSERLPACAISAGRL